MWTVTVEVRGDDTGSAAAARTALEDLLTRLGLRHVRVGEEDRRYLARLCVGGVDAEDAQRNAIALWRYAVEQVGALEWPAEARTIDIEDAPITV